MLRSFLHQTALGERLSSYRQRRPRSYSQYAEDAYLAAFYADLAYRGEVVDRGLFVDVGAYRPIAVSNSYAFHCRGWKCINIDPTPGAMRMFNKLRPTDVNLELAIGSTPGQLTFHSFGEPCVFNTLSAEAAAQVEREQGLTARRIPVEVRPLAAVLDEHAGGLPFEVLNIDVEGLDLDVLRSNDFARFAPRVILVEAHGATAARLDELPITQFLRDHGYAVRAWLPPTVMYARTA